MARVGRKAGGTTIWLMVWSRKACSAPVAITEEVIRLQRVTSDGGSQHPQVLSLDRQMAVIIQNSNREWSLASFHPPTYEFEGLDLQITQPPGSI